MKIKNIKCLMIVLVSVLMFNFSYKDIRASSISAYANTASVNPGEAFTVTVNIAGGGSGMFFFSGSNATVSEGSKYCDTSCLINVTAGSSGVSSVNISVGAKGTANEVTDLDGNYIAFNGAVSVNIVNPTTPGGGGGGTTTPPADNNTTTDPAKEENEEDNKDKDGTNTLASLEVSIGKLSPAFDTNTTTYDVSLPAGTTKITLNATAASDKATVEGVGEKDVITGDNAFEIICRAENGTTTTYTIRVNVSEKPVTTLKYGKTTLGVLSGGAVAGNLFEEQKIKVNGKEVSAWVNTKLNITLLYMQNEKTGEKDLYMYDVKKNEITSIYRPFAYVGKNLVMIDVPKELQERKGMKFTTVTLGDYKLPGWTFTDKAFENYMVIYVMDDAGNTVYYQYDKKENTLQLFSQAAALTQKDYEAMSQSKDNNMLYYIVIGILGVGCVVFCITTIRFYRKRNTAKYRKIEVNGNSMSAEAKSLLHEDN